MASSSRKLVDRIRGNHLKLCQGRFTLDTKKNFFLVKVVKHWNKLPRKVVKPLSLEVLKELLDMALRALVWLTRWGLVTGWTQ